MATNPPGTVSYTTEENNLITSIYKFPEYVSSNRSVSATITEYGYQEGAYKADNTIRTGYTPN